MAVFRSARTRRAHGADLAVLVPLLVERVLVPATAWLASRAPLTTLGDVRLPEMPR